MSIDRSYQIALIDAARNKLREISARLKAEGINRKPRLMIQLAAGGGKTHLSGMITEGALENGGTTAFLCHRDYLLFQTSNTYKERGIRHSYLAAGKPLNPYAKTHIGMIGSLKSRQGRIKAPTIAFSDEAHHGVARTWREAIEKWPDTTFIGLSATPGARSDGVGLNEVYDDIVCGPQVSALIELGALSDFRYYLGKPVKELMAVKKVAGEYSAGQQEAILDKPVIIGDVVGTYRKLAMGEKAVYFAPTIKMSEDLAAAFTAAGLPFQHMDKSTPDWKRKSIARAIADGQLLGFTNVYIAGEGFDLAAQAGKEVNLKVSGLVHRTSSLPRLIQEAMRCMRADSTGIPGKILDHGLNHDEHQWLPSDHIEWTLEGAVRRPRETRPVQCPHCLATGYPDGSRCTSCGGDVREQVRAEQVRREMEVIEGEMIEVRRRQEAEAAANQAALAHEKKVARWRCKTEDEYYAYAVKYGVKSPRWWAKQQASGAWRRRA